MKTQTITIIGAGLVGSLMSIYLGKRGYKVEVYEQLPDIRKEAISAGRSINLALANRGIRPLEEVGIMDKVKDLLIPMSGRMLHDESGKLQFQAYGQKDSEVIYSVSRAGLVSLLRDEAEATGNVNFHFKQKLNKIDIYNKSIEFNDLVDNSINLHHFDILLGADGGGSKVRRSLEALGIKGYSSELLEHSYKELTIPATAQGEFQIEKNALHIWPRGEYMLIALPNLDGSFTVTLFMPDKGDISFDSLTDRQTVEHFFEQKFSDAKKLMPNLTEMFFENPRGILGTVRSEKWDLESTLLIGDAAHAIVPFHGQGMNCGFEDCRELNRLLDDFNDNWGLTMPALTLARKSNANAIADMALENYIEMRDSVRDPKFHLKKAIAFELEKRLPRYFIPRYSMVMFHHIPYSKAKSRGLIQAQILNQLSTDKVSIDEIDFDFAEYLVLEKLTKLSKQDMVF
jgi:kynurenine 3-monooxygenase